MYTDTNLVAEFKCPLILPIGTTNAVLQSGLRYTSFEIGNFDELTAVHIKLWLCAYLKQK